MTKEVTVNENKNVAKKKTMTPADESAVAKGGKPDAESNNKLADFAKSKSAKEAAEKAKKAPKLDKAGLPKLPPLPKKAAAQKPLVDCACGCGAKTRSTFFPGHDQRIKGWATRVARGLIELKDIVPPIAGPNEQAAVAKFIKKAKADGTFDALKNKQPVGKKKVVEETDEDDEE